MSTQEPDEKSGREKVEEELRRVQDEISDLLEDLDKKGVSKVEFEARLIEIQKQLEGIHPWQ